MVEQILSLQATPHAGRILGQGPKGQVLLIYLYVVSFCFVYLRAFGANHTAFFHHLSDSAIGLCVASPAPESWMDFLRNRQRC